MCVLHYADTKQLSFWERFSCSSLLLERTQYVEVLSYFSTHLAVCRIGNPIDHIRLVK